MWWKLQFKPNKTEYWREPEVPVRSTSNQLFLNRKSPSTWTDWCFSTSVLFLMSKSLYQTCCWRRETLGFFQGGTNAEFSSWSLGLMEHQVTRKQTVFKLIRRRSFQFVVLQKKHWEAWSTAEAATWCMAAVRHGGKFPQCLCKN